MKGYQIAENLRTTNLRFTTGALHKNINGEDYFCVLGMKAFEAGVSISRLDASWDTIRAEKLKLVEQVYGINDCAGRPSAGRPFQTMEQRKLAVIDTFDSPRWHDFDFPVEEFIQYLKETDGAY
jgi:hypothetical protein